MTAAETPATPGLQSEQGRSKAALGGGGCLCLDLLAFLALVAAFGWYSTGAVLETAQTVWAVDEVLR